MKKNLLITLFLVLISYISKAQTIAISSVESTNNYCVGTPVNFKYFATGNFKTGNRFKLQVRPGNSNIAWQDLATDEVNLGTLTAKVPTPLSSGLTNLLFKIVSTDPVVESSLTSFNVNDVPNLRVTGTINNLNNVAPFEPLTLTNTLALDIYPYTVTFSDSSVVQVINTYELKLFPEKSGTYSVSKISNICGMGKATGSVNITVSAFPLKIVNTPGSSMCKSVNYDMTYSTTTIFDKDNKFKVRIKRDLVDKDYYDVDATLVQDAVISFKIGDNVPTGYYQGFQLISSNPAIISSFQPQYIEVLAKPNVEVVSPSMSINYGQKVILQLALTGKAPFSILLSDGKKINVGAFSGQNIDVYPEKDSQYFVESFSSGCGVGAGKNKMTVTVKPGVKIDSIPNIRYCADTKARVRIKANYALNPNDKYGIRMKSTVGTIGTIDVNATLVDGNFLEFVVPSNIEDKLGYRTVALAVLLNNTLNVYSNETSDQYLSNTLKTLEKPRGSFFNSATQTYAQPALSNLFISVKGGGSVITELSDGNVFASNSLNDFGNAENIPIEVYTPKTTAYTLKSISNECGIGTVTNNYVQNVNITAGASNFLYLKSSNLTDKPTYCVGEKIKYNITSEGNFDANSELKFEIVLQGLSQATTFLTTKEKSGELTIPMNNSAGNYKIRVYSTNPLTYSNYLYVFIKTKPVGSLSTSYSFTNGGEKLSSSISITGGGPFEVVFSDNTKKIFGKEGSTFGTENNENYFEKNNLPAGIFELKSVSNSCGVGSISSFSPKIKIEGLSYQIGITPEMYNNINLLCFPLNLAMSVYFSNPKATDISYAVQISSTNDTNYVNLATGQKNPTFSMILPDKYKNGSYRIRVVSEDAFKIKSNSFAIKTGGSLDEAVLSLNPTNALSEITVIGGTSTPVYLQKIIENAIYVLKDNFNRFYYGIGNSINSSSAINITPQRTTTYTLKSVNSVCGYNKSSGSVKIIVKPTLNASLKNNGSNTFCPNSDVAINLNSFGDFEKDNVFKSYIYKSSDTTSIREIGSTNIVENFTLKLPNDLTKGSYRLRIKSTNPVITKDFAFISVSGLPDVTLSGGTTININDKAFLALTPKEWVFEELEYELNDKTTGKVFPNSGIKFLIPVSPKTTTTYTLNSIRNQCGIGKFTGSATVEVNAVSDKQVNFDTQNFYFFALCTGSNVNIPFTTKGTFSATNVFTVQMSDAQGKNFKDIKTEGTKSPLTATIPIATPLGDNYLFRVMASDKDATSTTSQTGNSVLLGATARFDTASYYFSEGKPVKINVKFTGTPPYNFSIGTDEVSAKTYNSLKQIYELVLNPTTPTKLKLFNVLSEYCGRGSVIEPSVVSLELLTANENFEKMEIRLFPNPTNDIIYINSDGKKADLELVDITGISVLQKQITTEHEELNISKMKAGTYFLRVSKNDKQAVFKVLKL